MTLDLEKYTMTDGKTALSAAEFNARFYPIVRRLHVLEDLSISWSAAITSVQNYGLARINDAVQPLIDGLKGDLVNLIAQGKTDLASQSAAVAAKLADIDTRMAAVEAIIAAASASVSAHAARTDNPHQVTAAQIGGSVTPTAGGVPCATADARLDPGWLPASLTGDNLLIDGNFDYWFEGTSQASSGYGSDTMWWNIHNGSSKVHSQRTFVLGDTDSFDAPATYYSRTVVTSAAGAGNFVSKKYKVEHLQRTAGRKLTLSFQGRADSVKNMAISFEQIFGTGGTPSSNINNIGSQLIHLTTSFSKKTITVDIPSILGKTLGTDGNDYLCVVFWFDAGSSFDFRSADLGQQSGAFDIAQVKLECGTIATPFNAPDPQQELARIYRYFVPSFSFAGGFYMPASNNMNFTIGLPTVMRVVPTISCSNVSLNNCTFVTVYGCDDRSHLIMIWSSTSTDYCYGNLTLGPCDARL